ncbi:MAG TPA: glycosyltransferase family 4 protein [Victivallales bacterium]|nr:glycosyltransferase family 4 protein [Victivallales bacterium]
MKKSILHITGHFGGGVGKVLTALIKNLLETDNKFSHSIASLEYINDFGAKWCKENNIKNYGEIPPDSPFLHQLVKESDIVHLHFWNHPLIYHFLYSFSGKKARIIIWSHINGHHAPYIFSEEIIRFPEFFVLSTGFSLESSIIKNIPEEYKQKHLRTVFTSGGIDGFKDSTLNPHDGFNIGYVGTVDYCKMHRHFIDLCGNANIPNFKIIVCGGNNHKEIEKEAIAKGFKNLFDFRGQVKNILDVFLDFDIFVYPLCKNHYGTGEQALIEAMAAGIPQIVLDNGAERYVVVNNKTGLISSNEDNFTQSIEKLYNNVNLRLEMSKYSRKHAHNYYSIEKTVKNWLNVYYESLEREKSECYFKPIELKSMNNFDLPTKLFLTGLGSSKAATLYQEAFTYFPDDIPDFLRKKIRNLPPIFNGQTKGSIAHYYKIFKNSKSLKYLNKLSNGA